MLPSLAAKPEATCVDTAVVVVIRRAVTLSVTKFWARPG
jgi:hypothetical protein